MSKKSENHLEDLKIRIRSIDFLKILKEKFTYDQLSEKIDLPITVLNRYVKGHVIPSRERAEVLIDFFEKNIDLKEEILKKIHFNKWMENYQEYQKLIDDTRRIEKRIKNSINSVEISTLTQEIKFNNERIKDYLDKLKETRYIDNTQLLSDTLFLGVLAKFIAQKYKQSTITKILTAAVDGLPLAVRIADQLEAELIIAKNTKEVGVPKYIEENYTPSSSSGNLLTLYVPRHLISKKDRVLIVDDIIRSGYTQNALIKICKKINAKVLGVFIMIGFGTKWKEIFDNEEFKVETFLNIPDPMAL
ncbi:MAG: hypothetical protein EAX96_14250 [Candidatus Lokiarchaeota archaeon]|nr:hypothetical protein [Candidatus Lokiarchaeota archaeon]